MTGEHECTRCFWVKCANEFDGSQPRICDECLEERAEILSEWLELND